MRFARIACSFLLLMCTRFTGQLQSIKSDNALLGMRCAHLTGQIRPNITCSSMSHMASGIYKHLCLSGSTKIPSYGGLLLLTITLYSTIATFSATVSLVCQLNIIFCIKSIGFRWTHKYNHCLRIHSSNFFCPCRPKLLLEFHLCYNWNKLIKQIISSSSTHHVIKAKNSIK